MPVAPTMRSTTVYFATNRQPDANYPGGFGPEIVDPAAPEKVVYAVVPVTGIDLTDEDSGTLGTITALQPGNFASTVIAEIEATRRNLLVFIHGFDNTFEDAIKRAAFNREWFAASGLPEADTTVIAFTWPSAGELFASLPKAPQAAYLTDQKQAGLSGVHLAAFLRNVLAMVARVRTAGNRAFLLAHSMGNHALASATPHTAAASARGTQARFDEAILAAADEIATTFEARGAGMNQLVDVANRISIYSSKRDIAMDLSMTVNGNIRLGYSGPADETNAAKFPPEQYRSVDCTAVFDFFGLIPPDATHQYYRRSATVRTDIASLMAERPVAPGVSSLSALPVGV